MIFPVVQTFSLHVIFNKCLRIKVSCHSLLFIHLIKSHNPHYIIQKGNITTSFWLQELKFGKCSLLTIKTLQAELCIALHHPVLYSPSTDGTLNAQQKDIYCLIYAMKYWKSHGNILTLFLKRLLRTKHSAGKLYNSKNVIYINVLIFFSFFFFLFSLIQGFFCYYSSSQKVRT